MPTLLTRQAAASLEQRPACNFSEPSQNVLVEQQVTLEELKKRCARYKELLASLQPPQDQSMIRAANFTSESVLRMLQQNPQSTFIRVYYGIDAQGEHLLFMAPVTNTASLAAEEDTLYVEACCACPPLRNCPADELLEENQ
ncbi:MAG: hypothetical protein LPK07_16095 [Hymenobacteraceae bacterium]|nr:hypothetical protein [Hymenobacteraceae bacterium]